MLGQYIDQLEDISGILDAPMIYGQTPNNVREEHTLNSGPERLRPLWFESSQFCGRSARCQCGNPGIRTFGSRQEEAQRLGRILRPKPQGESAVFYSLVTRNTKDQDFSQKRQVFDGTGI